MSHSQTPWRNPVVKELLRSEREHFSGTNRVRGAKSVIKEAPEYAFDVSQEDEVADIFFHIRFIILSGSKYLAEFVKDLDEVREDRDDEAKRSDAIYAGSLVQEMIGEYLNEINDNELWNSEVMEKKDKFDQVAIVAAYWMKSNAIREILLQGKKSNLPLTQEQIEQVMALKSERQPFEDALATFTDNNDTVLDSDIRGALDKVPELKRVKFKSARTIFKKVKKLEQTWETELTVSSST